MAISTITSAGIATDTLTAVDIADDAIGTAELANDVVISTSGNITTTGKLSTPSIVQTDAQNLSGTYSTHELIMGKTFTATGDLTVNANLALVNMSGSGDDVTIQDDGTATTITGTGTLEAGELLVKERSVLTDMTGELGSVVTGGGGLTDGSSLTSLGTITSGEIGSGVTGYTGIKEYDLWRLITSFSGDTDPVVNWARPTDDHFNHLGLGMSYSTGIFTFPSTGIWRITVNIIFKYNGSSRANHVYIHTSSDSGGSYEPQTQGGYGFAQAESGTTYNGGGIDAIVDITNESTFRAKFTIVLSNSNCEVAASSTTNQTYVTFSRIGDT